MKRILRILSLLLIIFISPQITQDNSPSPYSQHRLVLLPFLTTLETTNNTYVFDNDLNADNLYDDADEASDLDNDNEDLTGILELTDF